MNCNKVIRMLLKIKRENINIHVDWFKIHHLFNIDRDYNLSAIIEDASKEQEIIDALSVLKDPFILTVKSEQDGKTLYVTERNVQVVELTRTLGPDGDNILTINFKYV